MSGWGWGWGSGVGEGEENMTGEDAFSGRAPGIQIPSDSSPPPVRPLSWTSIGEDAPGRANNEKNGRVSSRNGRNMKWNQCVRAVVARSVTSLCEQLCNQPVRTAAGYLRNASRQLLCGAVRYGAVRGTVQCCVLGVRYACGAAVRGGAQRGGARPGTDRTAASSSGDLASSRRRTRRPGRA